MKITNGSKKGSVLPLSAYNCNERKHNRRLKIITTKYDDQNLPPLKLMHSKLVESSDTNTTEGKNNEG